MPSITKQGALIQSNRLSLLFYCYTADSQRHESNIQSSQEPWDLKTYKSWYPLIFLGVFFKPNLSQPIHILWPREYPVLTQALWLLLSLPRSAPASHWIRSQWEQCLHTKDPSPEYGSSSTGKGERLQIYIFTREYVHIYWQIWVKLLLYPTVILKGWTLSCTEFKKLAIWYNQV